MMDESILAYKLQTRQFGNFPNLSHILQKPEPLETKFKVVANLVTEILLHLELQKGKATMSTAPFTDTLKATVACTKRLVRGTNNNTHTYAGGTSGFPPATASGGPVGL